jgi:hypothetical protein
MTGVPPTAQWLRRTTEVATRRIPFGPPVATFVIAMLADSVVPRSSANGAGHVLSCCGFSIEAQYVGSFPGFHLMLQPALGIWVSLTG